MLHSLKRANYFSKCSEIVGDFTDIKKNETKFGKNLYEIINEIVEEYNSSYVRIFQLDTERKICL